MGELHPVHSMSCCHREVMIISLVYFSLVHCVFHQHLGQGHADSGQLRNYCQYYRTLPGFIINGCASYAGPASIYSAVDGDKYSAVDRGRQVLSCR